MNTTKYISVLLLAFFISSSVVFANTIQTAKYINGPSVRNITSTTAELYLTSEVLTIIPQEEQSQLYFEYFETEKACIMIYPTPIECLPKITQKGVNPVFIDNLLPNTFYTVTYKKDSTIACVTTPCPGNGITGASMTFKTRVDGPSTFTRTLRFGSKGSDVGALQEILRTIGYLNIQQSTGYFGIATLKAVKAFQRDMSIPPTGNVGPLTKEALLNITNPKEETFEGVIQKVSTACFADGECSVTIDGKKVITTIGWSREVVGSIKGTVTSIGDIETQKIGARAAVFARKISPNVYTLYGNPAYFVEVK
jgi:hypothetical protein